MRLNRHVIAASVAMLVLSTAAALADSTTPAASAAPAAPAQAPAAPAAATPAAPAATTPVATAQVPQAVQDWAKFCDPAPDGHKICIVRKLVFQGTSIIGSFVLRLDSAKGVPMLAVGAVPVGVVLKPGLKWQIDKSKAVALPYWRCTPQSCESESFIKADFIARLKKGTKLTLTATNVEGKPFVVSVSLAGFGAAFDKKDAPTFAEYNASLPK
jgi:invasion protein IalB